MGVIALIVVRGIIHSICGTVAQMSVGVETLTGAYYGVHSVAQGVAHLQVDYELKVATVGGAQVLGVITLIVVRGIIHSICGTVAQMSVGIETLTGANYRVDGVAQGVIHV